MYKYLFLFVMIFCLLQNNFAQQPEKLWHGIERELRYHPEGNDIVIKNGKRRFNRALYGGNSAFRAEAGDLPEFAMYMPGMGGNLKFGLIVNNKRKWLIEASFIKALYSAGSMLYEIKDSLLGNGTLYLHVMALYDTEGMIVKMKAENIPANLQLIAVYGGATGKKFSRDGDIGADPESSFYLKPEYCKDNIFSLRQNSFTLNYGFEKPLSEEELYEVQHQPTGISKTPVVDKGKKIMGIFPLSSILKIGNASFQQSPIDILHSDTIASTPVVVANMNLTSKQPFYFLLQKQENDEPISYTFLETIFTKTEKTRMELANRIKINTPDSFINTLGPVLGVAADAIWEDPTYMHGAVAWRMRLNGWRGAYVADVLGWHDRAKKHFSAYALSQLTKPATSGVVMDTALHLARHLEKVGTQLFSDGYITRNPNGYVGAHHYDMNLVFIDQLLNHFNWTGDTAYVKDLWPLLTRHLAWEKKNFDADDDGLYDAYAAIWASDALQYSGGGVTHSSAYNYRANKTAAMLAKLIGKDGTLYESEAEKILNAINEKLWMEDKGWYAEYKDLLGNKLVHPAAALWTIYHAIDEQIANPIQAYQSLQYINDHIPHIPIIAKGLKDSSLFTLSTTNWQPYTWSLNNVALAELLHTSLAYWQGGRNEEAYRLWKSSLMESMYLGASPGNIQQLSFYDAIRGELYRDFADPIGMAARSLIEGLFGISPDVLHQKINIRPGFPKEWDHASISTPDLQFAFKRNKLKDEYIIDPKFNTALKLQLIIPAYSDQVEAVLVNGKKAAWSVLDNMIGTPSLQINAPEAKSYNIVIRWKGKAFDIPDFKKSLNKDELVRVRVNKATIENVHQPIHVLSNLTRTEKTVTGSLLHAGSHTFFLQLKQGEFTWFQPISVFLSEPKSFRYEAIIPDTKFDKINLSSYFNDEVNQIFKNEYLSPRPASPTLQIPTQGIGNWAYPLTTATISDSGLRAKAVANNEVSFSSKVPFATPSQTGQKNIVFTSMWDNYPDSVVIPLSGSASYAYVLLAGSTNPMQSRIVNGILRINYVDGSFDELELRNPENWWPIEQDYYVDGFAFTTDAMRPIRVSLKTGEEITKNYKYTSIKGFSTMAIDGGAATILDMHLSKTKQLKNLILKSVANDVVIGLMSLTLIR